MNPIFTWVIAETVARTTPEMLTGQRPEFRHEQVMPKEKFKRGGALPEVRVASPAQRTGEVRVYAA
jgi:hypothetical protein